MLTHPVKGAELHLITEASAQAIGAMVQQVVAGQVQPLAFFCMRTSHPESRYSVYDLELTSMYHAILHLPPPPRRQKVYDLHGPVAAHFKARDPIPNRQRNQLSVIREFCTDLLHVPGLQNAIAEALMGQYDDKAAIVNTIAHHLVDVNLKQLAAAQDAEETAQVPSPETSLRIKRVNFQGINKQLNCDTSQGPPKILVPTLLYERLKPYECWVHCGVDYAGPVYYKKMFLDGNSFEV